MATTSGYAKYADFLGEDLLPEAKAPTAAPNTITPEQRAAFDQAAASYQKNPGASVVQTALNPSTSARAVAASPAATGALAAKGEADQKAAHDAMVARTGGLAGDLGRLAVGGAKVAVNPINAVLGDYFPEPLQAAIGGPGYLSGALLDEGADQLIPGGSGTRGANIIPGVKGTGGDQFYPSETLQSGSYVDGYRGVGNPRADAPGGAPGAGGAGGAPGAAGGGAPPPTGVQRPDQYRTDALDPQIQAMLDAERKGGPSEAEALLKKATDRVAARSLGIAAGARGGAGARERARNMAVSANASLGATAAADTAALRAREANESKVRQQAIMALLQGNAAAGDVRDLGYEQTASGERSARYNVDAADARAAADRQLTRDQFNANQPPGLLDDPLSALFNYFTGRNLRSQSI